MKGHKQNGNPPQPGNMQNGKPAGQLIGTQQVGLNENQQQQGIAHSIAIETNNCTRKWRGGGGLVCV